MPALMTPKNAVTASNMTNDPNAQRPDLTARGDAQSKGFRPGSNFCRGDDDFVQQAMRPVGEWRAGPPVDADGSAVKRGKIPT
jgi:hypothetical protein